ncbi:MAG: FecR domain-containing protein, partial [Acidobacteriota bacterium]|nr:FecR domain-containing protein [Acidobacteriota bacterium]
MKRVLSVFAIILTFSALGLVAQDPQLENDSQGPSPENDPSRGVARISLLNGEVSVRRGDSGDVVAAALNAPLVSQDRVLTSSSSRAEVQFDSGNMLRIGSNSEVRLNDVQQRRFQVQLALGTITFRVLRNSQSESEIDTPSVSFRPLRPGSYRVTVRDDGGTEISVRDGEAEIFGPRGTEHLQAGVTILARGTPEDPEFREVAPIELDDWDRWNQDRDRQLESSRSYQYVSPEIAGAEDLEGYGRWANDPQYGNVWVPRVEAGWAPYRSGRWVWEDYYGWTWVSYDPWGWAPYHYGRWYSG